MATIDEIVRSVSRGQFISTFDAKSGYWQIGCPVSVVSTCVRNYLMWDLVVTLIVLTIVYS